MNARFALVGVALGFALWEAVDTIDTGVPAAVFSVLFLACACLLARCSSRIAALVVALLCSVEASQAHTWKDAGTAAKDTAVVLGALGILAAVAFVVPRTLTKGAPR